jgi:hypothetical protein
MYSCVHLIFLIFEYLIICATKLKICKVWQICNYALFQEPTLSPNAKTRIQKK